MTALFEAKICLNGCTFQTFINRVWNIERRVTVLGHAKPEMEAQRTLIPIHMPLLAVRHKAAFG